MPRTKTYSAAEVLDAAKAVFWESGFESTAISDLEQRTGLHRSSLYHGFGSKRTLFMLVLRSYLESFVDPLLDAMERQPPQLQSIRSFFLAVAAIFDADPESARRGCLIVNAMGGGLREDDEAARIIRSHPERLKRAFTRCLKAPPPTMTKAQIDRRAAMLASATLGVWLSARVDPQMAAVRCRDVAREVGTWASRGSENGAARAPRR